MAVEAKAPRASSAPAAPVVPEEAGVGAALGRVSYGLFVVASRRGDRYNGQTANTVFQVTSDPARVAIGINKKNLTHEFLAESGVAAVTVLGPDNLDLVRLFGFRSGREADKFAGAKYELSPVVGCPALSDGLAYLELRLDRSRATDAGTHTIFVGDVVGGRVLGQGEVMTYADYRELRSRPPAGGQTGEGATARDVQNAVTALNLEFGATKRYEHQIAELRNPGLVSLLEGVKRTEGDHVEASLAFIQRNTPPGAKGFGRAELYLQLNLDFEKVATATYGRFAGEASDPDLSAAFKEMARSEAGHVNIFRLALDEVKSGRTPVAFYCPVCGWEIDYGASPAEGKEERCPRCGARFRLTLRDGEWDPARV